MHFWQNETFSKYQQHLRSKVDMSPNIVKAGATAGAKSVWRGGGERNLVGKIFANPTQLGFTFRKKSAEIVLKPACHIFAVLVTR